MASNDLTPYRPYRSGTAGWMVVVAVLAVIGAAVVLPAFALVLGGILKLALGIVGAAIGIVLGIFGALIGIAAAVLAGVVAIFAVLFGLAMAILPILLLIAVFVGIGVLLGRSARHS